MKFWVSVLQRLRKNRKFTILHFEKLTLFSLATDLTVQLTISLFQRRPSSKSCSPRTATHLTRRSLSLACFQDPGQNRCHGSKLTSLWGEVPTNDHKSGLRFEHRSTHCKNRHLDGSYPFDLRQHSILEITILPAFSYGSAESITGAKAKKTLALPALSSKALNQRFPRTVV